LAVREDPEYLAAHRPLVAALALAGRAEEAAAALDRLLALEPGFTVGAFMARQPLRGTAATKRLAEGLRLAGLPDA
jgi:hypothetical protein